MRRIPEWARRTAPDFERALRKHAVRLSDPETHLRLAECACGWSKEAYEPDTIYLLFLVTEHLDAQARHLHSGAGEHRLWHLDAPDDASAEAEMRLACWCAKCKEDDDWFETTFTDWDVVLSDFVHHLCKTEERRFHARHEKFVRRVLSSGLLAVALILLYLDRARVVDALVDGWNTVHQITFYAWSGLKANIPWLSDAIRAFRKVLWAAPEGDADDISQWVGLWLLVLYIPSRTIRWAGQAAVARWRRVNPAPANAGGGDR